MIFVDFWNGWKLGKCRERVLIKIIGFWEWNWEVNMKYGGDLS